MKTDTYTTHSAQETQHIAATLAAELVGGEHISLIGDLGAGKTTFVQGLVAALGSTARVKSPTFTVMNEYTVQGESPIKKVIHCDFYRFTSAKELDALEIDTLSASDTIILVEWPNIVDGIAWNADITVTFAHAGDDARTLTVVHHSL